MCKICMLFWFHKKYSYNIHNRCPWYNNPEEAVCILHGVTTIRKGMNAAILPPAKGKL